MTAPNHIDLSELLKHRAEKYYLYASNYTHKDELLRLWLSAEPSCKVTIGDTEHIFHSAADAVDFFNKHVTWRR